MEYKRAAVMLPSILKRAMMLAAVCLAAAGVAVFCAVVVQGDRDEGSRLRVGYTAKADPLTDLAVSYIQNIESIRSLCSLEAVTEQEGRRLLESGELSALIVLPEDVVNEILSGSNTPAVLYLPERHSGAAPGGGPGALGSVLFEEIASAGMGMLATAQAEIYASDAVLHMLSSEYAPESMYDDINRFNLQMAAGREKLFRTRTLSLTENDTYVVYFGSALFTVYMLAAGLFFGKFCKRSSLQQTMADRRVGVCYAAQLLARCLAGSVLMAAALLLPFLAVFVLNRIPHADSVLADPIAIAVTWQGMASLFLITGFMTVYFMMIYQIVEKRESALVVTGILAVLQAYLSGCLIPTVLLPDAAAAVGAFLPASMVKRGFTILLTGDVQSFPYVVTGLCVWGLCLFLGTVVSMRAGERDRTAAGAAEGAAGICVPPLAMVMLRRLLRRKSMWISLGAIVVLSAVITEAEQRSKVQVRAAVYDESGDYEALLEARDGLILFERYGSEEAVRSAVLKGDAECGYVLPATLAADMAAARADRKILVYQAADAVAVPVVNEILFERIFRQVSLEWFEDYIAHSDALKRTGESDARLREIASDCFDRELLAGTTFRFEIRRLETQDKTGSGADQEKRTIYPARLVAALAVILCALQGILQVAGDIREHNFYKRNRLTASALTLLLPVLLGVLCAVLILYRHAAPT